MSDTHSTAGSLNLIRCDIADETYGLDMAWVRSVQRVDRLRPNPETKDLSASGQPFPGDLRNPAGWLPTDEGDVPVFHLAARLGRPRKALSPMGAMERRGQLQRVIVLHRPQSLPRTKAGELWGLLVDRISQVFQISTQRVLPLPPIAVNRSKAFFIGVTRLGDELVLVLSPDQLHPDAPQDLECLREATSGSAGEGHLDRRLVSDSVPLATERGDRPGGYGRIVVFSIGESTVAGRKLSFGLGISQVPEVLEPLPRIPVPAAPDFVLGLVNWRDRPVPLIDLGLRLGMHTQKSPSANGMARLMIVRSKVDAQATVGGEGEEHVGSVSEKRAAPGAILGFLVQAKPLVLKLPIECRPSRDRPLSDMAFARGVVEWEGGTLVIPDLKRIMTANEDG